ncbi:head decoration protein [Bradyrhizobium sp. Ec3.3]|uniref:head decoration protein n=1 Tax=Bradyrhizobium sp. Ec3.3 TaxID=189753 RepID=UPI0003FFFF85|nr:head decoration protein [Bradyrhizobium sp. Ec3.3]
MTTKVLTEPQHRGEFLVSEANGHLSREVGTLASGNIAKDGRALKLVGGKLVPAAGTTHTDGTSDENIVGIALGDHDASATGANADVPGVVYIARLSEVKGALVTLHAVVGGGAAAATAAVKAALAKLNIIER